MKVVSVFAVIGLAAVGCTSAEPTPTPDPDLISFSVQTTVAPASEVQLCKYITMPTDRGDVLAIDRIQHDYTEGSHHFLVYQTTLESIPQGGEELVACDESNWMSVVRGVAYAAQSPAGEIVMPEGVSQRFRAGEVLLVQTHYLNPGAQALSARVDFDLRLTTVEKAPTEAGFLFFFNPIIHLPPNASASAELSCPIPEDVNLIFAASHMHKQGVSYDAHLESDGTKTKLYETDDWSEPLPAAFEGTEGAVPAGSRITYSCQFENTGKETIMAGPSAQTDEMCMFIGLYYPRLDTTTELCNRGAAVTKGTTSCLDTVKCAGACDADDKECRATCLDQVCPTAAIPMLRFLQCFGPKCSDTCKSLGADSPECKSCATANCLTEASTCQSATCPTP